MEDIVPLAYDLKKAKAEILTPDSMYQGMAHAYTGSNIGVISNNITKVWNSENISQEQLDVVKWLTFQNNAVIDYAKTLWLPTPPKEVEEIIRSYTKAKVPDFFKYAKNKESSQVEKPNDSVMNRICAAIPDSKLKFSKSVSKFDYQMLMNLEISMPPVTADNPIVKSYDYWNRHMTDFIEDINMKNQDMYKYKAMRQKIIGETGKDLDYIVNALIYFLYTERKTSGKKALWSCFGDVIVKNLKKNLEGKGKICPICGKRFVPDKYKPGTICCGESCSKQLEINRKREKRRLDFAP